MSLPDEITFESLAEDGPAPLDRLSKVIDAIDAASDQDRTTWLTDKTGKRIAKIAPVDEIPESAFTRATAHHDEILAGFERAYPALREWRERYLTGTARLAPDRGSVPSLLYGIEARLNTIGQRLGSSGPSRPGIITQLARMEALQMVMARQVEEVHRTLGRERDEEDDLVPAEDELLAVTRDLLVQVLTDAGADKHSAELAWDTLRSLTLGTDPGSEPTPEMISDLLSLAGVTASPQDVQGWTPIQRDLAWDWAAREHLAASDNDVATVSMPTFLAPYWRD